MARTEARIYSSVWNDDDFTALSIGAQWLYWALLSQPELSMCGVLTVAIDRWARLAAGITRRDIVKSLNELARHRFVTHDETTSEVWLRAFIRRDGVTRSPNLVVAMARAFDAVHSKVIREALISEITREFGEDFEQGIRERFPQGFKKGIRERFPQGFWELVHGPCTHVRAPLPITPSPPHHLGGTLPENEPVATTSSRSTPSTEEEQLILQRTFERLAQHDLQRRDDPTPIRDPKRWLTTTTTTRRERHLTAAQAHLAANPAITVDELAEHLDPSCGPDDGGLARSQAKADATDRILTHKRQRTAALDAWRQRGDQELDNLDPEDLTALEQQARASFGDNPPRPVLLDTMRTLALNESPPDDGDIDEDREAS